MTAQVQMQLQRNTPGNTFFTAGAYQVPAAVGDTINYIQDITIFLDAGNEVRAYFNKYNCSVEMKKKKQ